MRNKIHHENHPQRTLEICKLRLYNICKRHANYDTIYVNDTPDWRGKYLGVQNIENRRDGPNNIIEIRSSYTHLKSKQIGKKKIEVELFRFHGKWLSPPH